MHTSICQVREIDDAIAKFALQLGIKSINITTPRIPSDDGIWKVADLVRLREDCEQRGLRLEVIENTAREMYDKIMLGLPGRDQQLENYCTTIRNVVRAGIPILGFHFMATDVWRTDMAAAARGGANASAYRQSDARYGNRVVSPAYVGDLTRTADDIWDNYRIFLEAVLPVAEEVGLKLAQHPDDPPVEEINGIARVFNTPENLIRAYELSAGSPAWGLDLCLGTVSEMAGGADAVRQTIDYFGPLGKIRYVHFRDVQGTVPEFSECFLGEGNYDPAEVIRQLKAVGFDGWLQDDHVPFMSDDTRYGHRARAYEIGYIQGLLRAIDP
ncbi:MAG: mannonate dehydratase [Streptosporangiaceae bacterium]